MLEVDGPGISRKIAFQCMPLDLTDKSTVVEIISWCRQVPSHYLSQCSPSSISPCGVTRPQWINVRIRNSKTLKNAYAPTNLLKYTMGLQTYFQFLSEEYHCNTVFFKLCRQWTLTDLKVSHKISHTFSCPYVNTLQFMSRCHHVYLL